MGKPEAGANATATQHCDTCTCDDASALATFNARCRHLIREGSVRLTTPMSEELAARISTHPQFAFGFREWMPSHQTTLVAAMFLAAVCPSGPPPDQDQEAARDWRRRRDYRFFGVVIPNPIAIGEVAMRPMPFEYSTGDVFDVHRSPYGEDLGAIASWSDERIAAWLTESLDALHTFVEHAIGAW